MTSLSLRVPKLTGPASLTAAAALTTVGSISLCHGVATRTQPLLSSLVLKCRRFGNRSSVMLFRSPTPSLVAVSLQSRNVYRGFHTLSSQTLRASRLPPWRHRHVSSLPSDPIASSSHEPLQETSSSLLRPSSSASVPHPTPSVVESQPSSISSSSASVPHPIPSVVERQPSSIPSSSSASSSAATGLDTQRLLLRMFVTLGGCGFLTACGYFMYLTTQSNPNPATHLQQGTSPNSTLFPNGRPLLFATKSTESGFLQKIEAWGDYITDRLQDLFDKYIPVSREPLLPDVADLKYPESLPTLVIDLDKVLIKMEHDRKSGWRVIKRPGADEFFKELVYHYELVVWSDDNFPVAQEVCAKWGVPVVGALHRDQCKRVRRGHYVKDLSRLGRRLERVLILDHDPIAFSLQPENGILVREYDGNPNDTDLYALTEFLKVAALSPQSDIRDVVKSYGGGDVDLVKRWTVERYEQEKKTESWRSLGNRLFGGSSSGSFPGTGRASSVGWT